MASARVSLTERQLDILLTELSNRSMQVQDDAALAQGNADQTEPYHWETPQEAQERVQGWLETVRDCERRDKEIADLSEKLSDARYAPRRR